MVHMNLQKFFFSSYKQISGRNGVHEWFRMTNASYYVIYNKKFRKVMQRTKKEALMYINALWSIYVLWEMCDLPTKAHPYYPSHILLAFIQLHCLEDICCVIRGVNMLAHFATKYLR